MCYCVPRFALFWTPNEESVILLMGKTAMDKKSYLRQVPRIDLDKDLFPDE